MSCWNECLSHTRLSFCSLAHPSPPPPSCGPRPARRHTNSKKQKNRTAGVSGFGYNLDTASSPTSAEDRSVDGGDSVDPEDTWWVAAAAGAGVGLGIVLFAALVFTKFGKKSGAGAGARRPSVEPMRSKRSGVFADETKAEPY